METPDLVKFSLDEDSDSRAEDVTAFGDLVVITFENQISGRELWIKDRGQEDPRILKDINPGSGSATPLHLTVVGETLFFSADDGNGGRELWKSDGTPEGTVLVKDINPGPVGSFPLEITSRDDYGPLVFFSADDGSTGDELWVTNGTPEFTLR